MLCDVNSPPEKGHIPYSTKQALYGSEKEKRQRTADGPSMLYDTNKEGRRDMYVVHHIRRGRELGTRLPVTVCATCPWELYPFLSRSLRLQIRLPLAASSILPTHQNEVLSAVVCMRATGCA